MRTVISTVLAVMIAVVVVLLVMTAAVGLVHGQNTQTTLLSPNKDSQHTTLATQYGNATVNFPVQNGLNYHTFTVNASSAVTSLTTTIQVQSSNDGYTTVATSSLDSDSISWSGTFTAMRVIYSNFGGSGSIDADYYGSVK